MKRPLYLCVVVFLLVGCGDSTGPVPNVGGTYQGAWTTSTSSPVSSYEEGPFPATATISQRAANLTITITDEQIATGGDHIWTGTIDEGASARVQLR